MEEKKTSNPSWTRQLSQRLELLKEQKRSNSPQSSRAVVLRSAIVGAGSELNGDDAAGLWVVRGLQRTLQNLPHFLSLEAGVVPDNALGPLRRFAPELVLLVDAADLGLEPGAIRFVENAEIGGFSASSHTLPLGIITAHLSGELGCPVWLIGIQPASLEFAEPLTAEVQRSVDELVDGITDLILSNLE